MNYDDLEKINELREKGILSEEEFQKEKAKILNQTGSVSSKPKASQKKTSTGMETNQYCMLIHLSQFAGFIVPFFGLITPIILWAVKKDDDPVIDAHGKAVTNWVISTIIYAIVSFMLVFIFLGVLLLIILAIITIIFPIIGAVKANDGELWKYPLSIPFFTVPDVKKKI